MWAMRLKDGTIRSMKAKNMHDKKCFLCGQYFKPNEDYCIIVIPFEYRSKHKKLKNNFLCHTNEWIEFSKGVNTYDEMAEKIINHKIPRKKEFSDEERLKIDCFRRACIDYGFREEYEKPFGLKMKQKSSSVYLIYNVYQDTIDLGYRGKCDYLYFVYQRQIISVIYNKMHEYLGDGKRDEYSMKLEINKFHDNIKKIMEDL